LVDSLHQLLTPMQVVIETVKGAYLYCKNNKKILKSITHLHS